MAKTKVSIRQATIIDSCDLLKMLKRMFEEAPVHAPPVDDRAALAWISKCIDDTVFVAECDGQMVGSVGFEVSGWPWAPEDKFLHDTWFYVVPEYRNTMVASALIDKIKLLVKSTGLTFFGGVSWGGDRVELKDRFIERHGFTYVGGNFTYGLSEK